MTMRSLLGLGCLLAMCGTVAAVDTDGDGLLDLMDAEGFRPRATGHVFFGRRGIEDLDGANLLTSATSLDLNDNQIAGIEPGDFDGLNKLNSLSLYNNQISSIEHWDFVGLTNLQWLILDGNRIASIEPGDFAGLSNLQWLGLSGNRIASIEPGDFEGLNNLRMLGLNGNRMNRIPRRAFEEVANMQDLSLGWNQIASIEAGDFHGLSNLLSLNLSGNRIASIEPGDFEGLSNLLALYLNGNKITGIEPDDFVGLSNLRFLNLNDNQITSIQSEAFTELSNLQWLELSGNHITVIKSGDFDGLTLLRSLYLSGNRITNIENGAFAGLTNLEMLGLTRNRLTELNLTRATFDHLIPCIWRDDSCGNGFAGSSQEVSNLVVDDAVLSRGSFDAIVGEARTITDVSLVGLTFSDANPANLSNLLRSATLDNVAVDQFLYDQYADEFNNFAAMEGNYVIVVPGLCDVDRDTNCDVSDIDQMLQNVLAGGRFTDADLQLLIHRTMPHGFNTYFGDANLDGTFDSEDLVAVLAAGEYEDGVVGNSTWSTGDWNADSEFTTDDFVTALADGGYEAGPRPGAVPEPGAVVLLVIGLLLFRPAQSYAE